MPAISHAPLPPWLGHFDPRIAATRSNTLPEGMSLVQALLSPRHIDTLIREAKAGRVDLQRFHQTATHTLSALEFYCEAAPPARVWDEHSVANHRIIIDKLVAAGCSVHGTENGYTSPLWAALHHPDREDMVASLMQRGASPLAPMGHQTCVLRELCERGRIGQAKDLLEQWFSASGPRQCRRAISALTHQALKEDSVPLLQILDQIASPDTRGPILKSLLRHGPCLQERVARWLLDGHGGFSLEFRIELLSHAIYGLHGEALQNLKSHLLALCNRGGRHRFLAQEVFCGMVRRAVETNLPYPLRAWLRNPDPRLPLREPLKLLERAGQWADVDAHHMAREIIDHIRQVPAIGPAGQVVNLAALRNQLPGLRRSSIGYYPFVLTMAASFALFGWLTAYSQALSMDYSRGALAASRPRWAEHYASLAGSLETTGTAIRGLKTAMTTLAALWTARAACRIVANTTYLHTLRNIIDHPQ